MGWPAAITELDPTGAVMEFLQGDPLVVGAVVLGLLLVVLVLALSLRRYRRSAGGRLRRLFASYEEITFLLHLNPDPDAMATAMGLSVLAEEAGTECSIRYPGEIRHQENRAFRTVLDLDISAIDDASDLRGAVVLVDHNRARGFDGSSDVEPIAVIDHHPGDGQGSEFTDVRTDYGACATIVTEYLRELGYEPVTDETQPDKRLPVDVATGLLYGILSDTNHLSRGCSAAEFEASSFLYPGIDQELLDRIAHPEVDAAVLDVKARAIDNRTQDGPFVVSDVGEVSNIDTISQAAEELLHLEGTTAVVVMGEKDGTLHLSGRSRDDRVHMGDTLEWAVEDVSMSSAGGHARMGGGQVSLDHMNGIGPSEGLTIDDFVDRLFDAMAGELS